MATRLYIIAIYADKNQQTLNDWVGIQAGQGNSVPLDAGELRARAIAMLSHAAIEPCRLLFADAVQDGLEADTAGTSPTDSMSVQFTVDDSEFSAQDFLDFCSIPSSTGSALPRTMGDIIPLAIKFISRMGIDLPASAQLSELLGPDAFISDMGA